MAQSRSIPVQQTLRKVFPEAWIWREARACGVIRRRRKLDPVVLFWSLLLGFGGGRDRTLAGLRRAFNRASGCTLSPSSFYKRFTPALRDLMRRALEHAFEADPSATGQLEGILARFRDVILIDTTLVRLHESLAGVYPGLRNAKASLKMHTIFSVRGAGRRSVQLTSERVNETRTLVVGSWVRGHLLVVDLGYFAYELFARIDDEGGFFLSRLKRHVNLPVVCGATNGHKRLRDVLAHTDAQRVDLWVEMPSVRTASGRWSQRGCRRMRVIGVRAPNGQDWHLYLTNVPPDRLDASELAQLYAARWEIELLFKEAKSHYGLADMPSRKKEIVETLLYAAMLTLVVSRRLAAAVKQRVDADEDRVRAQRWASCFRAIADALLHIVVQPARFARRNERRLTPVILREAVDPNAARQSLLRQVARAQHAYPVRRLTPCNAKQIT